MGVHIPDMKRLAGSLVKDGKAEKLLAEFEMIQEREPRNGLNYEEKQVWGMIINRMKIPMAERLELLRRFIPAIDNWAVCDTFCADAKWMKGYSDEIWKFLQDYFYSRTEFKVRFAIVTAMCYYLDESHIHEIYRIISQLEYG